MNYLTKLYKNRFSPMEQVSRKIMWSGIYDFFLKQFFHENDTVMDIGSGRCELLNLIKSRHKIAVDLNPDSKKYANKNIQVLSIEVSKIPQKYNDKIDVVMLSNFLEHLNSKDDVIAILNKSHDLLRTGGKVLILQPNINLIKEAYWDFIDHKVALNTKSLIELLNLTGFKVEKMIEKFLPYTTKGGLPISRFVIYLYLLLPQVIKPFAGQSLVVGIKK